MYIVFQELLLFIILEILKMIEGICNAFNYLFGGINISNEDNTTYILDYLFANNTLNNTFNIIILFSLLIGGILSIISLIKNMINNSKSIVTIISQFFISIILVFMTSMMSLLTVTMTNNIFVSLNRILNIKYDINIGYKILDICTIDYNNLYSINEINFNIHNIKYIFGDQLYESYRLYPISWENNGCINPNTFLYLPCLITSIIVLFSFLYCAISLAKRLYEIILLYFIMPVSVFTISLDNGNRFKLWTSLFLKKILTTFIIYISLFLFIFLYELIITRYVHGSSYDIRILNLIYICGGALLMPLSQRILRILLNDTSIIKKITLVKEIFKKNVDVYNGELK